jgi:hypothetical protein
LEKPHYTKQISAMQFDFGDAFHSTFSMSQVNVAIIFSGNVLKFTFGWKPFQMAAIHLPDDCDASR